MNENESWPPQTEVFTEAVHEFFVSVLIPIRLLMPLKSQLVSEDQGEYKLSQCKSREIL